MSDRVSSSLQPPSLTCFVEEPDDVLTGGRGKTHDRQTERQTDSSGGEFIKPPTCSLTPICGTVHELAWYVCVLVHCVHELQQHAPFLLCVVPFRDDDKLHGGDVPLPRGARLLRGAAGWRDVSSALDASFRQKRY